MGSKIKSAIKLTGLVILIFLLVKVDLASVVNVFKSLDHRLLIYSLLVMPITICLFGFKWQYMLNAFDIKVSFVSACSNYLVGLGLGIATPGKLGAFARTVFFRKEIQKKVVYVAVVDKFIDMLAISLFSLFTLQLFSLVISIGLISVCLLAIFWEKGKKTIMSTLLGKRKNGIQIVNQKLQPKNGSLLITIGLSLVAWGLIFFQGSLVAKSFGLKLSVANYFSVAPFSSVVGLIPISISGFGTRDAMFVRLMSQLKIDQTLSLTLSIVVYVINAIIPSFLGGLLLITNYGDKKLKDEII